MSGFVELRNISKNYAGQRVIAGMNLSVAHGEFVTVLGPSGCGKTTLLSLLARIEAPSAGEIRYGQEKCFRARMMFQEYGLFPWRTCLENVVLGMAGSRSDELEKKKKALEWLAVVSLTGHEGKYPKELSGGMKQRVALAQALASEAKMILMDEPFGALDSLMREALQNLVMDIWRKFSKTVVFVTHNVREAVFLGNRVLVMGRNGEIVLDRKTPVVESRVDDRLIELEKEVRASFRIFLGEGK